MASYQIILTLGKTADASHFKVKSSCKVTLVLRKKCQAGNCYWPLEPRAFDGKEMKVMLLFVPSAACTGAVLRKTQGWGEGG